MDMRRWMLTAGCAALLLVVAGCVSDEVVYVDEQGNELAVDTDGQPLPGTGEEAPTFEAPAFEEPAAPAQAQPSRPTAVRPKAIRPPGAIAPPRPAVFVPEAKASTPEADPSWDLPPAGAAKSPLDAPPGQPKISGTSLAKPPQPSPKIFGGAPAAQPRPEQAPPKKAPAKKIDSSAGLDLPPAG